MISKSLRLLPLAVLLITACTGDESDPASCGSDAGLWDAADAGATDEETALLENAQLSVICNGPGVEASADLTFSGAHRVPLQDGVSTIALTATGAAKSIASPAKSFTCGLGMQVGSTLSCFANFVPVTGGARYLTLSCFHPPFASQTGLFALTIGAQMDGDAVTAEGLSLVGVSVGAATCDVTSSGTGSYTFTLSGEPEFFLANRTRTLGGG